MSFISLLANLEIHYLSTSVKTSLGNALWLATYRIPSLLAIFFVVLCCGFGIAIVIMSRRAASKILELQLSEERRRIDAALSEQKAVRLQNETLQREIQERISIQEKLAYAAYHDTLTELYNRAYLTERITEALACTQDKKKTCATLLYLDLDRFKSVNDMLGHRYGDKLLLEVAHRLKTYSRPTDTVARISGDEFALLLDGIQSPTHAVRLAQRILGAIEEPITLAGISLPISASIGLCELNEQYAEADEVLRDADTAMYRAKRKGGSCVVTYEPSMYQEAIAELESKMELKAAVDEQQFELYYQPLVDLRDRTIVGLESLIRWNHPHRGTLAPGSFIPLAEETGHIVPIGSWVLRASCNAYKEFRKLSERYLLLTVNVSIKQLNEPFFLSELKEILDETEMDAALLQLEITESIFLKDADRIGKLLDQIRSLGVKIAFDDFGTGYSSLNYLSKFPVDTLKIDQSFVKDLAKGTVNADIVQLIIQLAQTIDMDISAEGVEEPSQAETLVDYGCNIAQGFLFSKPVSFDEMKELLRRGLPLRRAPLEVISHR